MSQTESPAILDRDHLDRMTLGDAALAREVLALFAGQAGDWIYVISADADSALAAAHSLKGSARAIGAWAVAEAVADYEHAIAASVARAASVAALNRSLSELLRAIEGFLAEHASSSAE